MKAELAVLPDTYLEIRRPSWAADEQAGRVRASRHLVWVGPGAVKARVALALALPAAYAVPPYAGVGLAVRLFDGEVTAVRSGR